MTTGNGISHSSFVMHGKSSRQREQKPKEFAALSVLLLHFEWPGPGTTADEKTKWTDALYGVHKIVNKTIGR